MQGGVVGYNEVMTTNKRKAIKDMFARMGMHANADAAQVVDALENYGIEVSERFVTLVRSQMIRDEAKAERQRSKRGPKVKSKRRQQQRKIPGRR